MEQPPNGLLLFSFLLGSVASTEAGGVGGAEGGRCTSGRGA